MQYKHGDQASQIQIEKKLPKKVKKRRKIQTEDLVSDRNMFKISQKLKNFFWQTKFSPFIVFFADLDKVFIVWYVILEYLASKDKNMKP